MSDTNGASAADNGSDKHTLEDHIVKSLWQARLSMRQTLVYRGRGGRFSHHSTERKIQRLGFKESATNALPLERRCTSWNNKCKTFQKIVSSCSSSACKHPDCVTSARLTMYFRGLSVTRAGNNFVDSLTQLRESASSTTIEVPVELLA
eukprot:2763983-Pyramimonas_sp.AAC.4